MKITKVKIEDLVIEKIFMKYYNIMRNLAKDDTLERLALNRDSFKSIILEAKANLQAVEDEIAERTKSIKALASVGITPDDISKLLKDK